MNKIFSLMLCAALLLPIPVHAGPFEDGKAAYDRKDYQTALKLWQPLAEQGNAEAQYHLGSLYSSGFGTKQDPAEALKWFHKSAELGHPGSQVVLGYRYQQGAGVPKDANESQKWFQKAIDHWRPLAEQGDAEAQYQFSQFYSLGWGVEKDGAESVKWLRKAAEQGNAQYQETLAFRYEHAQGVAKDIDEAQKWYRKAMEHWQPLAEQGNAEAQFHLAQSYSLGRGVKEDDVEAVRWLRLAAEQGNTDAQNELGNAAFYGAKDYGLPQDTEEAKKWYLKSGNAEKLRSVAAEEEKQAAEVKKFLAARDHGLAAAKQKKWDLAIKYFTEAREKEPANPELLFNLALAYDHAKGRELLALCFFHAYLAMAPDAPNAEQVRKRIPELEIIVEDNIRKMAKTARDSIVNTPRDGSIKAEGIHGAEINFAAETLAFAGDIDGAYQLVEGNTFDKPGGYTNIALAQAQLGDIEGAKETLRRISSPADIPSYVTERIQEMETTLKNAAECFPPYIYDGDFHILGTPRFNCQSGNGSFGDERIRRAFQWVIQKELSIKTPADGIDGNRARQLLAEAGFPEGKNFATKYFYYESPDFTENQATGLQAAFKRELGVTVELQKQEPGDLRLRPWERHAARLIDDAKPSEIDSDLMAATSYGRRAAADLKAFLAFLKKKPPSVAAEAMRGAVEPMAKALYEIRRTGNLEH